ncbi:MAG: carbamoyltransferase HypF [Candidatus Didemnitutus sp.]|nr:carbamoyltransferase HypF [Candidatus Didemnitutus sp.]
MSATPTLTDTLLRVRGTVQGVGFRPFVHRTAVRLGLRGWVRNDAEGVLLRVHGEATRIAALVDALHHEAPPAARVVAVEHSNPSADEQPVGSHFTISESDTSRGTAPAATTPPDLALCADCERELLDPTDRRHLYPFINCTQCGPRYSLIEQLPYDRPRTTMRAFRMCAACEREYHDPLDRRFHAEPNACRVCGPKLSLTDPSGQPVAASPDALHAAVAALRAGRIIAVKGLGGFHLMCDAAHEATVAELRTRKHREEKPLAVMFPDLATLREYADVSPVAEKLLTSPEAPIVLVRRFENSRLAYSVAPSNPWIGALLPYTPLHVLLLRAFQGPLVATSANLSEEPLCTDNSEARERLAGIADLHLAHDRIIARPVDDSVVRLSRSGQAILLRRARGYAPTPLRLPSALHETTLCVGAQMKNTIAVASGDQVVVSPHLGDLGNAATQAVFERTIATLSELYEARPLVVVHDKHPDYASTHFADRTGLPQLAVQHHLAHVLACLLEHEHAADGVLGISWDGTGYGEDGTVWGGEFILLEKNRATRFARLRPFRLLGGDAAVKDARRVALGLGHEMDLLGPLCARFRFSPIEHSTLQQMLVRGLNSPLCSSAGRLFDGVSALLGLCLRNNFEGQAPLHLEAAATRAAGARTSLPFDVVRAATPGAYLDIDWAPALSQLLRDPRGPDELAADFHRGLARAMVAVATEAGVGTVALTGGCFQNALLHDLATEALGNAGFKVLTHRHLSPNDNSIAAGQALAALWGLTSVELPS